LLSITVTTSSTSHTYTLSLHDALPILPIHLRMLFDLAGDADQLAGEFVERHILGESLFQPLSKLDAVLFLGAVVLFVPQQIAPRSEEHTSELQSRFDLVCRLLLEKKKK